MLRELHRGARKIRNSIQHADERRIPEGEPLFPAMTTDCLYIAGEYIPYAEIASLAMIVWQLANVGVKAITTG